MISRRVAIAGAIGGIALQKSGAALAQAAALVIVYLSASDCSNCRGWEQFHRPDFVKSPAGQRVPIRELTRITLQKPMADSDWPADLKWIPASTQAPPATPAFILIQGQTVLARAWGASGFDQYIVPKIKQVLSL